MIVYDGIINSLQLHGGIGVLFHELNKRMGKDRAKYYMYNKSVGAADNTIFLAPRILERYREFNVKLSECDVFHSTYYRLPTNKKLPVVTTVHDFTYERFVKGPAKWVHSWQKNRAIRNSDLVICVSHNTAKDLQKYCPINPKKIRVIYNGVSDSYHPLDGISSEKSQDVVFVGARSGYKNFTLAVESVATVPNLQLKIVGGGKLSEDEIKHLDAYLPNRYQWLGRLSDEELNQTYNKAYALLYPSSYEGFGIPVIEAMRAGCPVIAVNVSSIPEVAGNAAILVDKATVTAFSEALIQLPAIRQQLISTGFTQAAKFSWERCFEETLEVYNELLAK